MKIINSIIWFFLLTAVSFAQSSNASFIKGDLNIRYNTRGMEKARVGVEDIYTLNINMSNSALFRGTINHKPTIKSLIGKDAQGGLTYAIELDVVNPNNPVQTRNVGRLYGFVPIDSQNIYRFTDGEVKAAIFPIGNAKGFESKFSGLAAGKPPAESQSLLSAIKKEALSLTKSVNGKAVSVSITKYDKMEFSNHVLVAGPVQIYPEVSVNGPLIYDYNRMAWHLDGILVTYNFDGKQIQDKITGNIRWIPNANEYQFDVRVNEPSPNEAAVFAGPSDESAFFSTDNAIPSLTGSMKYKDSKSGDIVMASSVTIDLTGNKLTKQQMMYLCKLFFLSSIVPLNAE